MKKPPGFLYAPCWQSLVSENGVISAGSNNPKLKAR